MSCNISVPIEDIAESVAQMLRQQFIEKDGGTGTGNTLTDTVLRGGLTFDTTAKQAICDAIERCVAEQIKESQAEQDADIEDKINAGDDRLEDKINGFEDRIDAGRIVGVTREDDTVTVKLANGNEFPFSITDSSSGGDRPVQFAPSSNGDNIEITLADGSVLDMTRQEFADWLAGDESPLTTDEELEALANDIANNTGDLQSQIDALNDKFKSINYDQATLSIVDDKLVLRNEDNTEHEVPLTDLIPLSPDAGNLLTMRDNGIYYGIEAEPNLANLYVDGEHGNDDVEPDDGGGSYSTPFKTLERALQISPSDKSNKIHLRSVNDAGVKQEYQLESRFLVARGATRTIASYDQPYMNSDLYNAWREVTSPYIYIYPLAAQEWVRPVIHVAWVTYGTEETRKGQRTGSISLHNGGLTFTGVEIEFDYPEDMSEWTVDLSWLISGSGAVIIDGSYLRANWWSGSEWVGNRLYNGGTGYEVNFGFRNVLLFNDTGDTRELQNFIRLNGATINLSVSNYEYVVSQTAQDLSGQYVTFERGNIIDSLKTPSFVSGIARHSTGVPLNVTSNFEI